MNTERLLLKGQLAELQKRRREIELRAESLHIQLREILNPILEFVEIETERLLIMAKDFRNMQLEIFEIDDKIKKVNDALGL